MKIEILAAARRDIADGFHFYEQQAPGVGAHFLRGIYSDIESLRVNAGVHAVRFQNYHCLLSKRFPFAVYYRVENQHVKVHAILDMRRDPAFAKNILGEQ